MPASYIVYATTDNEMQAAAIAQRLIEKGRDATTADVADLLDVRSSYLYAVLAEPICDLRQRAS